MIVTIDYRDIINCKVTIVLCNGAQVSMWYYFKFQGCRSDFKCRPQFRKVLVKCASSTLDINISPNVNLYVLKLPKGNLAGMRGFVVLHSASMNHI